jgi:hypothetical protein
MSIEDLIADENGNNYFTCRIYKRTNLTEYKTQNRGGVKKVQVQEIKIS